MNNKKLWYPAAMVIALSVAFGTAHAKSLEQSGAPTSPVEALGNYGVDVAAKAGLKSLIPSGWNLFIYKNTDLPSTISWTVQDTWLTALERFGTENALAIRVDWNKQAIYVSSLEVALQQKAKLAELDKASATPLPAYSVSTTAPVQTAAPVAAASPAVAAPSVEPPAVVEPAKATAASPYSRPVASRATAPVSAEGQKPQAGDAFASAAQGQSRVSPDLLARALAKTAAATSAGSAPSVMPSAPVAGPAAPSVAPAATAPVVIPVATTPAAAPSALPVAANPIAPQVTAPLPLLQKETSASDAFAHGNMEDIVRKTASKHGFHVSWETISLPMTGPVTFLGADPAEDMRLLQKSLGMRYSPIAIEVYRGSSLIRITANNQARDPLAVYDSSYSGIISYGVRTTDVPAASRAPAAGASAVAQNTASPAPSAPAATINTKTPSVAVVESAAPAPVVAKAEPAPAPVAATMTLTVEKGENLSKAVERFLKSQNWELRWQVAGDLESDTLVEVTDTSVAAVLKAVLPKLGLDTDLYAPSRMAVIRPIDVTAD